ncbi:MAG: DUF2807 domain-containing protein [Chitinophagales bacterium]
MIKTVNINLGGIVYQIDEDAFEELRKYLDSLNQYYKYTEGRDEIVADIESRLAELFTESLDRSGFKVVSMGDVAEVIDIMGRPEDFDVDGEMFEESETSERTTNTNRTATGASDKKGTKRLYRDPDNAIIAGVSSGLSAYWNIDDPLWIRLAFILSVVFSVGILPAIYVVLWIILPKAKTASQKLEMKGEPVNINNLEKKIREEINQVGENLKDFTQNNANNSVLRKIVNGIGKVLGAIAKVFFLFFKILFSLIAVIVLVAAVIALFASLLSFLVVLPLSIKYIFASTLGWLLALVGGVLVLEIPILLLIYVPLRIFTKYKVRNKNVGFMGLGLFFIGVIFMCISAYEVANYFSEREIVSKQEILDRPVGDTLYVALNDNEADFERLEYDIKFSNVFAFTKRLETASDWIEMDVRESSDENIYLETILKANGNSNSNATKNAESISHNVKYDKGHLTVDPYFGLGDRTKWRNQSVKLKLNVPEGTVVVFDYGMGDILDNVDNSKNVGAQTVAGNRWLMHDGILEPIDSVLTLGSSWSKRNMTSFDYQNFDQIELSGNVEVEIEQGDAFEVHMLPNKRFNKYVEVEKNGNTLKIDSDHNRFSNVSIGFMKSVSYSRPKFYIVVPDLKVLNVSGLSHAIMDDVTFENLKITLTGQGSTYMDNIEVKDLTTDIHGQSSLRISGKADKYTHEGSGQSNMEGEDLTVNKLFIDLSAQSDAEMTVIESIDAELSGQSDFDYWGDPKVVKTVSGQSDVTKRD